MSCYAVCVCVVCWEPAICEECKDYAESERVRDTAAEGGDRSTHQPNIIHTSPHKHRPEEWESVGVLVLTVQDSGPALTPEQLAQVFGEEGEGGEGGPGVQLNLKLLQAATAGAGGGRVGIGKDVSQSGSSGSGRELELWIAKGIIELHHGHLFRLEHTAQGNNQEYLTGFRVELPAIVWRKNVLVRGGVLTPSSPRVSVSDIESDGSDGIQDSGSDGDGGDDGVGRHLYAAEREATSTESLQALDLNYNVLVVEDSAPARKLLCRLLTNLGCRCSQAQNGLECLDKMHHNLQSAFQPPFDFILMDYEMPR